MRLGGSAFLRISIEFDDRLWSQLFLSHYDVSFSVLIGQHLAISSNLSITHHHHHRRHHLHHHYHHCNHHHYPFSPECELAEFASGGGSTERIPFVYLPLSGQLVNITFFYSFWTVDSVHWTPWNPKTILCIVIKKYAINFKTILCIVIKNKML